MILFLCMPKEKVSKKKRQLTKRATPEVFFRDRQELAPASPALKQLALFNASKPFRTFRLFCEGRLSRKTAKLFSAQKPSSV